jgi:hypothetical protein
MLPVVAQLQARLCGRTTSSSSLWSDDFKLVRTLKRKMHFPASRPPDLKPQDDNIKHFFLNKKYLLIFYII